MENKSEMLSGNLIRWPIRFPMIALECDDVLKQESQNRKSAHYNTVVGQSAPDVCQG